MKINAWIRFSISLNHNNDNWSFLKSKHPYQCPHKILDFRILMSKMLHEIIVILAFKSFSAHDIPIIDKSEICE